MIPSPPVEENVVKPAPLELSYIFGAHFADGTDLFQQSNDLSRFVEGKNAMYDLYEHNPDGSPVVDEEGICKCRGDIELFQYENDEQKVLVDLRDGHFEVGPQPRSNRSKFTAGQFFIVPPPPGLKLSLVVFRRRRHLMEFGRDMPVKELAQECEYHLGWKVLVGTHWVRASMFVV